MQYIDTEKMFKIKGKKEDVDHAQPLLQDLISKVRVI